MEKISYSVSIAYYFSFIISNYSVVEAAVNYAYTGRIRLNSEQVFHVYLLANNLGCSKLLAQCVAFMKSR